MLRFHSDRKQVFECKIKIEGDDLKESTARLVLQDGNVNRVFEGKIDVLGNFKINMPPLDYFVNPQGKATMEVRINDVIFEPYREEYLIVKRQVVVADAKVIDFKKQPLYNKRISIPDKKMVKELLNKFNKLPAKHKKTLKDYVEFKYVPDKKVQLWAKKRFNDLDSIQAKMVMYQVENILQ